MNLAEPMQLDLKFVTQRFAVAGAVFIEKGRKTSQLVCDGYKPRRPTDDIRRWSF